MNERVEAAKQIILDTLKELDEKRAGRAFTSRYIASMAKTTNDFTRNELISAVYFLSDDGLVKKISKDKVDHFRLSSKGAQTFQPTKFLKTNNFSNIVLNQHGGIAVFGSDNNFGTVNQNVQNIFNEIDKLVDILNKSSLEENRKREAILDAETLKTQLAKSQPNTSVIKSAWDSIVSIADTASTVSGLVDILKVIYPVIKGYIPDLPSLP